MKTLKLARTKTGKGQPVVVIVHAEMGNGVDYMMHTAGMEKHLMMNN